MVELDFISEFEELNDYEEKYLSLLEFILSYLKYDFSPIVSVSIVDNKKIKKINKKYRQIDKETDVISFAFLDGQDYQSIVHSKDVVPLGDIYISYEKAKEQAIEYGHSIERELYFLFTHGILHLLGYDHMKEEDEKVMFALQEEILNARGIFR